LTIEPPAVDFGIVQPGSPGHATITLRSTGDAPLEIYGVDPPATAAFGVVNDGCSKQVLAPLVVCQVELAFNPPGSDQIQDTIVIHDSTAEGSHPVSLTGSGYRGQADLMIKFAVIGDPQHEEQGGWRIPVEVAVFNVGDAEAGRFRIGAQAAIVDPPEGPYSVPLVADESDTIDPADSQRPATRQPLAPGQTVDFRGWLRLGTYFENKVVDLSVIADSCAGEEISDPVALEQCLVPEGDERNNVSDPYRYTVPIFVSSDLGAPLAWRAGPFTAAAPDALDRREES